ncbi:nucleoside-diphosphate-sugar epimerase [Ammoniphilus resinae]|uniref:Nucleoside-diphosphate-sugar epimerase n=2 Tax=Ammoniphilus resinae TaxID=861532 RepID=A0ABS4GSN7_9BACL|nr:nucleoside-diphosphate-sugar epimerase [Ammoniphilus resinae]
MFLSERLNQVKESIGFVQGDISEWDQLLHAIKQHQVQTIIHLAYYRDIQEQEKNPHRATKINCLGFNHILEAARIMGIKRVVWASSTAVYGYPHLYNEPVDEDALLSPTSIYGACKAYDEYLSNHYRKAFGLETIGLRPTVVYGDGRWYRGLSNFTYDLFAYATSGKEYVVQHGDKRVDWLHVKDCARAFVLAALVTNTVHGIFNITGQVATLREATEAIQRIEPNARFEIKPGGREEEYWPAYLDGTRAKDELGYIPEFDLSKGCKDYLDILRASFIEV